MKQPIQTKVQVRFADVDSMGHVNHAKFFTYMEQARMTYFRNMPELDFRQRETNEATSLILASIQCDFLSPAYLDESLVVSLRTTKMKRSSFEMEYEIKEAESGRPVARGQSTLVYFDYAQQKSLPIPESLRKKFSEIEGRDF